MAWISRISNIATKRVHVRFSNTEYSKSQFRYSDGPVVRLRSAERTRRYFGGMLVHISHRHPSAEQVSLRVQPHPPRPENDQLHRRERYARRSTPRTPRRHHRLHPTNRPAQTMCFGREALGPSVSRTVVRPVHAFGPSDGAVDETGHG